MLWRGVIQIYLFTQQREFLARPWEKRTLSSVVVDRFLNRFGKQGDPPAGEEDRLCSEEDSEVSPLDLRFSSSDESSKRSGTSNCKMAWRIPASFLMLFDLFFTLYKRKKKI